MNSDILTSQAGALVSRMGLENLVTSDVVPLEATFWYSMTLFSIEGKAFRASISRVHENCNSST